MVTRPLDWLDLDYSEDAQGHGSFDAIASVNAALVGTPAFCEAFRRAFAAGR